MPRLPLVLALAALVLLATSPAIGPRAPLALSAALALGAVGAALLAVGRTPGPAARIAALVACLLVADLSGFLWQPVMILALAVFLLLARLVPGLRRGRPWCVRGRVPVLATLGCAAVTPVGLVAWLLLARPDLSDVVGAYVPDLPVPILLAGAVGFAVLNATLEETLWRGIVQEDLGTILGPAWAVAVQAASFGLAHAHGVPRGIAGVLLAGAWGVLLGLLRQRAGGLLAPILAHVVADATIATIVLLLPRP
ncbi:MAG: CPBP family intramembrane metalloprotease [Deltaproteobacteria bacterium]|nr:CPBP family intramembrane metalloprotease [Deltaproteobacteria bacterium]